MADPRGVLPEAPCFAYLPEIADITAMLSEWDIQTNRIPYGCIMQDSTVILTAAAPDKPIGNPIHNRFSLNGKQITIDGTDVVCLRYENNQLLVWSNDPVNITEA